jgi:glucose repression regulatory protein TUP1
MPSRLSLAPQIWELSRQRICTIFEGHQRDIYSLDFSRDGRLIISGSGDKTVRIWDMETGQHKALVIIEPADVRSPYFSVGIGLMNGF